MLKTFHNTDVYKRQVYVFGEFNDWNETSHEMKRVEPETMGVYEL